MISGAIVSAVALTIGIKYYGFVAPGLIALSVCVSPDGTMTNLLVAVIGVVASFVLAFVLTLIMGFEDEKEVKKDAGKKEFERQTSVSENRAVLEARSMNTKICITSPMKGKIVPIENVPDATFAEEKIGKGIAVLPEEGKVYAPFDGKVAALMGSKHAIGLVSKEGVELLIHIGTDTVNLKGKYFEISVKQGQEVKKGELLIEFDKEAMEQEQYSLVTPIVVTNTLDYLDVLVSNKEKAVAVGEELLTILK